MDCAFCEGTGNQPEGCGECTVCGRGGMLVGGFGPVTRCERCDGSGKYPYTLNLVCDVCKGTGIETLDDDATINMIMDKLWEYPDEEVAVFSDASESLPSYLLNAQWTRRVTLNSEINYFIRPDSLDDIIKINPNPKWDWERKIIADQSMLRRTLVTLTERERRTRDTKAVVVETDHQQSNGALNNWTRKNTFWVALIVLFVGAVISWMLRLTP